jgi:hypothetical protein
MRLQKIAAIILISFFGSANMGGQSGGPYTITSSVIGAGGSSSGGTFALTGTIGQFAAGSTLSSGPYSLDGGFWPTVAEPAMVSWSVGGTIMYGTTPPAQPAKFVPGVNLMADGSPQGFATTDADGFYQFNGLGGGPYMVTLAKSGNVNGISSLDATRVQQFLVGITPFDSFQTIAADATNNGSISSLDATRIQQFLVGISAGTNVTGQWKFVPASRDYDALSAHLPNENFVGILVGDVTGNWLPPASVTSTVGGIAPYAKPPQLQKAVLGAVDIALPKNATAANGEVVTIPIVVTDLAGLGVLAYDFTIFYDPGVLEPAMPSHDITGTLSSGMSVLSNSVVPGALIVSAGQVTPLTGTGTLLNLRFNVIGSPGEMTSLTFLNSGGINTFLINEGEITNTPNVGMFTVLAPTAASVSVSGRVTDTMGLPITRASIRLTDSQGATRSAITNPFGYFKIPGVTAGETYIVAVSHKNFIFATPQVVTVDNEISDLNFVAIGPSVAGAGTKSYEE